jgi:hypothetical protein
LLLQELMTRFTQGIKKESFPVTCRDFCYQVFIYLL